MSSDAFSRGEIEYHHSRLRKKSGHGEDRYGPYDTPSVHYSLKGLTLRPAAESSIRALSRRTRVDSRFALMIQ